RAGAALKARTYVPSILEMWFVAWIGGGVFRHRFCAVPDTRESEVPDERRACKSCLRRPRHCDRSNRYQPGGNGARPAGEFRGGRAWSRRDPVKSGDVVYVG